MKRNQLPHEYKENSLNPIVRGMNAPDEYHQSNIKMGKDVSSYFDNGYSGVTGAVASGKRQPDGSIKWDWNYEMQDTGRANLLEWYVLPTFSIEASNKYRIDYYGHEIDPSIQAMDPMPSKEFLNPLMAWKKL